MNGEFDGSFKIYVDPKSNHANMEDIELGHGGGLENSQPYDLEMFTKEVDSVKKDMKNTAELCVKMQECNEAIKTAESAKAMKELRAGMNTGLENVLKLAKQINRKFDGLVRANAAQRKVRGDEQGSNDDQARASMLSNLGEGLMEMMRKFQGLRAQMETEQRQVLENRYFTLIEEKATAEAIDALVSPEAPESLLHHAMTEHGRSAVMDAVAEIRERRDAMREIRRNMMALHQIFLGMAAPVDPQGGGGKAGGPPSPVENFQAPPPAAAAPHAGGKAAAGQLNDYERETRKQAYIAIALALVIIIAVIVPLLQIEARFERGTTSTRGA